jgi:enoyl-CoA hydratase/carnithine racemase
MIHSLLEALSDIETDFHIGAVVLASTGGRAFSAGADLAEFTQLPATDLADAVAARRTAAHQLWDALRSARCPTVAAVGGYALGAGMLAAACCDVRLASTDASFGLPEIGAGVLGGAAQLVRVGLPAGYVRLLALTGDRMDASTALRTGFVQGLVEPAALREAAVDIAGRCAAQGRTVSELTKRSLVAIEEAMLVVWLEIERELARDLIDRSEEEPNFGG